MDITIVHRRNMTRIIRVTERITIKANGIKVQQYAQK